MYAPVSVVPEWEPPVAAVAMLRPLPCAAAAAEPRQPSGNTPTAAAAATAAAAG